MKQAKVNILLAILLGFLVVLLYRAVNTGMKYMSIKEMYASSIELADQKSEIAQLSEKLDDMRLQIEAYRQAKEDETIDYEAFLRAEIESMKKMAGVVDLAGPGVIIIVSDGTRELQSLENPNNVLVHDLDIRYVVDDLRNAGAEAISINNQRILFDRTRIVCTGPTIKINDQVFAPPYVIQAIGDRKLLESAINAPGSFSEDLRAWGVYLEVYTSVHVVIPAFESVGFVH